ncbi:hypothetical protein [Aquisphaera insulae]|uniref:hypothetical protein n=1 Tax=Aquisphaera insulae TaxID=2712864 RepID=UPI0013EE36EE|nr:hypothetical protein [Aquisphaera insulae]
MWPGSQRARRKVQKVSLAVEGVEERVLLSTGIANPLREQAAHFAKAPKAQKLVLAGNVKGTLAQQIDADTVNLAASLQGKSGNKKLGNVTISATGTAPLSLLQTVGRSKLVLSGLTVTLTSASGTDTSAGTLTLGKSKNLAKVPFTVKVQISNGTGLLAGASGTYTIQGTFNALSTSSTVSAQLKGTIMVPPAS